MTTILMNVQKSKGSKNLAEVALKAAKQRLAEQVVKAVDVQPFLAEEVSGAVAMNKAWHASVQTPLRQFIQSSVFDFRKKELLSIMSANVLTGITWEAAVDEAWEECSGDVRALLGRAYAKAHVNMAKLSKVKALPVDEEELLRTVNTLHQHSEFYYKTYLQRIAAPQIEKITTWMEANPAKIATPAGTKMITRLNKAIRARSYHDMLSSVHTGRSYNFGAIDWMKSNDVRAYIIEEVLDNRTCEVCITFHGRIYTVKGADSRKEAFLDAGHPADARNVMPFPTINEIVNMQERQIMALDGPQPPFHPLCRGSIRPA